MYGVGGGWALPILSCLAYIPHLFMYRFQGSVAYYSELSEIIFYLFAGLVIGFDFQPGKQTPGKISYNFRTITGFV